MKKMILTLSLTLTSLLFAQGTTAEVFQHHVEAWNTRNVDATVADYRPDSVVIVNHHVYRGQEQIRALFQSFFRTFDRADSNVFDPTTITGNIAYLTWHATFGAESHDGVDTFVIENGKIAYQTVTSDDRIFTLP